MIRKPDAREFRDSDAVLAIRDARTVAVEGARGVGQGTAKFFGRVMMALFGFGFLMSVVGHLGSVGLLLAGGGAVTVMLLRGRKRTTRMEAARWAEPAVARPRVAAALEPERHELSVGAAARSAATFGVPAILLFPTSSLLSFMLPFTFGGIVALALAFLILSRLSGDRTVLGFDAETVTVRGLLGEATILWQDVADVAVERASFFNLRVLFTSGSRRNLVVLGRRNRLGGPETLFVALDLLDLDSDEVARLVARMAMFQTGTPFADADATAEPARLRAEPLAAERGFDPDAIIARHIAERDALVAAQRPQRPTFGRKAV